MIVKTSADEKRSVSDVRNTQLGQQGKLTLHKRLVARSEAIITRDDVTDMTPDMETLVKDLDRNISSQANVKVTSRIELAIDPAEVTRIKKALSELGNGKCSSVDDGTTGRIKLLEQNVQQLQRDLTSAQSERAHFAQQVTALQQERAHFAQQVTALQQELAGERHRVQVVEQEVNRKDDQIKRNEAEIASCKDDILSKVKEMEQQELMYDQLQTDLQGEKTRHQDTTKQLQDSNKACSALAEELQGEKTRHQDTTKQLQDSNKACSALAEELQGEKTRHQDTVKQLQDSNQACSALAEELQGEKTRHQDPTKQLQDSNQACSALAEELQGEKTRHQDPTKQLQDSNQACSVLENDVASYQLMLNGFADTAPPRETPVTEPSRPTHPQTEDFCFHDNHGTEVVLSNNQQTAEYRSRGLRNGIVMSRDPMEVNKLYEVHITKRGKREGWALCVGVVTSSPDSLRLPSGAGGWQSAVVVYSGSFSDHGDLIDSDIGKALKNIPPDSRVGVRVVHDGSLHLHVNGADQGVVPCRPLHDPCWALWELTCRNPEVTTLPVTHVD
ncbi:myosin heavy chain, striated muscle-like [Littorina saxatilis]|uniref:myosin heavy chain, striated muscle-like n=1 Tax=Littorina saxatilis TaxID=31220 RepID=UPI0038B507C1